MSSIEIFLNQIADTFNTGSATEHSYRSSFETLFKSLDNEITALNEPKRVECGAPDFIIQRGSLVIGHLEAKDLAVDIRNLNANNKEQKERYLGALPNLIYTNGLDWDFFRNGSINSSVSIGTIEKSISPDASQFSKLESLLSDFIVQTPITISRPKELSERMAGKAKLIKSVFHKALSNDLKSSSDTDLATQFKAFQENLIHDIEPESFAEIYAETICYGMFAARLHDDDLETFSRHEALDKLPKNNPFLKSLFSYVAGSGLDDRIAWIIDDLADIFRATDVASLMSAFGTLTGKKDPFLHFYETFLAAYNPSKRKSRGVWYTPEPVVSFIIRAVDAVLKMEFDLVAGLADTSKITIDWDTGQKKLTKKGKQTKDGKNAIIAKEVHRVQLLDPATGTGTFLAEVIKNIAPKVKDFAPGSWSNYVEKDLLPRIHGFEILMASYAMCHMKLDMVLKELGYKPSSIPPRQSVYLTNSLEEGDPPSYELPFAQWLANEVKLANSIKSDMPIMCVIGNPPYSGISQNMGEWITNLIEDYKYVDGVHFGERKHWLQDDYVKFIRLSEELIEKNGEGILGFITSHGYLDNPTFRGMRWHLLNTFDRIWILDLHGNSKRNEVDPSTGKPDSNVFDIMQGVSIIVGVKKKGSSVGLAEVMYGELWGDRNSKYKKLNELDLADDLFQELEIKPPRYPFVQRDWSGFDKYREGFLLTELFCESSVGVQTSRDNLAISYSKDELKGRLREFCNPEYTDDNIRNRFFPHKKAGKYPPGDSRGWSLVSARRNIDVDENTELLIPINYRPFDTRYTYYSKDLIDWPREKIMSHFLHGNNIGLLIPRQLANLPYKHAFVTNKVAEMCVISNRTKEQNMVFPLYLYDKEDDLYNGDRKINFNTEIYKKIVEKIGGYEHDTPAEIAIFDYIYGVLSSPTYRELFSEFLKIEFPRIPWPSSSVEFWKISFNGKRLRELHLMSSSSLNDVNYSFEGDGDNVVKRIGKDSYRNGDIWINDSQCFKSVPQKAWEIWIGSYQPARKWLKDREGRVLAFDDVKHYQKIITTLIETDQIMNEINLEI